MSTLERRYQFLRTELAELDQLLSMTPESEVIDRRSLEYRRSQVQAELEANPPPPRWPVSAQLFFNGKPLVDRQGIYADFAGEAVNAFSKAVTSLAASQLAELGERGTIRNRDNYRLIVTGTSSGSFGFDIEEILDPQTSYLVDESPVELAIGQAKTILASLAGDEEVIAEAIADTDERALNDLRDFLKVMVDSEAVCTLSFKNDMFRFRDVAQVRHGLDNLGTDNVHEGESEMFGHFQGFLPKVRRAEFVEDQSKDVLSCRVDRSIDKAEEINELLGLQVHVRAHFRQVGNSRPRYTIMGYDRTPRV